ELVIGINEGSEPSLLNRQIQQAVDMRALHHPRERMIGKTGPRIAAADIGMNADKPHLADALAIDLGQRLARIRRCRLPAMSDSIEPVPVADIAIVPKHGMKGVAFLVERERVTGAHDLVVHELVGYRQRPIPVVYGTGDLVDRTAIGVDRVPDAEKIDLLHLDQIELPERRCAENTMAHPIAQPPQGPDQDIGRRLEISDLAIFAIGYFGSARQVGFVALVADQADAGNEARDHADGKRAPAESEAVDPVAVSVVAAAE